MSEKRLTRNNNQPNYNTNYLLCICGDFLSTTVPLIYGPNRNVCCNICCRGLQSDDIIYHCSKINDIRHVNGFDLCDTCAKYNMTASVTLPYFLDIIGNEHLKKTSQIPKLYRKRETCFSKLYYHKLSMDLASNKHMESTLNLYKTLFAEIYSNPLLLSPIVYDDIGYHQQDRMINILTKSIIPNPFSLTHEHILTQIICDVITRECHVTYDLTTFLRENSSAIKLFSAYLRREPVRIFIDNLVKEACTPCLIDYKEDVDIDPSAVNSIAGIANIRINNRKQKLIKYIDFILSKILNPEQYPLSLRIICKTLMELSLAREPTKIQLKNSLIGGLIFLRIFNARIMSFTLKTCCKEPYKQYEKNIRRKFTLISKILQLISNHLQYGHKEKWMGTMNEYIFSKFAAIDTFFNELCNIRSLNSYFNLNVKMLHDIRQNDCIYICINDLITLTTALSEDHEKRLKYNQQSVDDNKRFHKLVSDIMDQKHFINENKDASDVVKIMVRKHRIINNNKQCNTYLGIQVKKKVIRVLRDISKEKQVLHKYKTKNDLMKDIVGLLKFVQTTDLGIRNVDEALEVLMNKENVGMIQQVLLSFYAECAVNLNVFNRLNYEIKKMTEYNNM